MTDIKRLKHERDVAIETAREAVERTDRIVIKAIEEDGKRRPADLFADHGAVDEYGIPVPGKRRRFRWPKGSLMARWNSRKARIFSGKDRERLDREYEADLRDHAYQYEGRIPNLTGPIPGDLMVSVGDTGAYADALPLTVSPEAESLSIDPDATYFIEPLDEVLS